MVYRTLSVSLDLGEASSIAVAKSRKFIFVCIGAEKKYNQHLTWGYKIGSLISVLSPERELFTEWVCGNIRFNPLKQCIGKKFHSFFNAISEDDQG
jgi:hypothetical protein